MGDEGWGIGDERRGRTQHSEHTVQRLAAGRCLERE